MTIEETRGSGLTSHPVFAATPVTVGISVGITTPEALEKSDIKPPRKAIMGLAVFFPVNLLSQFMTISVPWVSFTILIIVATPQTSMMADQGI